MKSYYKEYLKKNKIPYSNNNYDSDNEDNYCNRINTPSDMNNDEEEIEDNSSN